MLQIIYTKVFPELNGLPISRFVFNSENNVNITYTMSGLSITFYWTSELLFWTGERNWVPSGGGGGLEILESKSSILVNSESIY